jgi:hypothetical protein
MIGVDVIGRMGNQMFQYAFALVAAHKINTRFFLKYYHYPITIDKYFELPGFNRHLNKMANKIFYLVTGHFKCIEEGSSINPQILLRNLTDNTLYKGYFQTEMFFKDISDRVRTEFRIKRKYQFRYKRHIENLVVGNKKLLVIHFRGKDYKSSKFELPLSYYQKCLSVLSLPDYQKIVVTDDIEQAKIAFRYHKDFNFECNESIIDFQFIMNADTAIISNSTFAWWGAYLNKKSPIVYAPKNWLGYQKKIEYPKGIMSVDWNWIN